MSEPSGAESGGPGPARVPWGDGVSVPRDGAGRRALAASFAIALVLLTLAVALARDWPSWWQHVLQLGGAASIVAVATLTAGRVLLRVAVVAAALCLPALALLQRVGLLREFGLRRAWLPTLWFDNPNILAGSVAVLAVAAVVLLHRHWWAQVPVVAPAAVVIMALGSRTAMVVLIVGLAVALASARARRPLLVGLAVSIGAAIAAVAALQFVTPRGEQIIHPWVFRQFDVQSLTGTSGTSLSSRLEAQSAAWLMFRSAPAAGVGRDGYPAAYEELRPGAPVIDHAHNLVLHLLATLGLIGAAGWLVVLVVPTIIALRRRPRRTWPVIVAVAAANVGEYSLFWFAVYGTFWIVVACALFDEASTPEEGRLSTPAETNTTG